MESVGDEKGGLMVGGRGVLVKVRVMMWLVEVELIGVGGGGGGGVGGGWGIGVNRICFIGVGDYFGMRGGFGGVVILRIFCWWEWGWNRFG
jgi:hypothetical protein